MRVLAGAVLLLAVACATSSASEPESAPSGASSSASSSSSSSSAASSSGGEAPPARPAFAPPTDGGSKEAEAPPPPPASDLDGGALCSYLHASVDAELSAAEPSSEEFPRRRCKVCARTDALELVLRGDPFPSSWAPGFERWSSAATTVWFSPEAPYRRPGPSSARVALLVDDVEVASGVTRPGESGEVGTRTQDTTGGRTMSMTLTLRRDTPWRGGCVLVGDFLIASY